jgi:UDP-glucose 4-epimerase
MSVLVTGGTGAIGSNVARALHASGRDVVVFDRVPLTPAHGILGKIDKGLSSEVGTVTDLASVLAVVRKYDVDGIIHCAGMLPPHDNDTHPIEALNTNIIGTANILEISRTLGIARVLTASAAGVMGRPTDMVTPRKEEDISLPLGGIYPLSKLACEQLVYAYRRLYKTNVTAFRPRNVYGPGANPRIQPLFEAFFAAVKGEDFVRDSGGDSTFDYTYIKDITRGIVQLFDAESTPYHVYNISRGRATSMSEAFDALAELFPGQRLHVGPGPWEGVVEGGKEFELTVHPAEMPPQDVSRAAKDFGYQPEWDIDRGLADWARWYRTGEY